MRSYQQPRTLDLFLHDVKPLLRNFGGRMGFPLASLCKFVHGILQRLAASRHEPLQLFLIQAVPGASYCKLYPAMPGTACATASWRTVMSSHCGRNRQQQWPWLRGEALQATCETAGSGTCHVLIWQLFGLPMCYSSRSSVRCLNQS